MARLTMTIDDVCKAMRAAGIPCSKDRVSAGLKTGCYPFGRIVNVGETGRTTFEIYRVDFEAWLRGKFPEGMQEQLPQVLQLRRA